MKKFNFTDRKDIQPSLLELRCPLRSSQQRVVTHHLEVLDDLARDLRVSSNGLQNARRLAKGYGDLVVVLIEPTNKAEEVAYNEMLAASKTLLCVDKKLKFASRGQRDLENTIILDIRAFRSDSIRTSQILEDRNRDDELAYGSFERIITLLRPRVVVACQCATAEVDNRFVQGLCSSIRQAGDMHLQQLPNECKYLLVKSFHPMSYKRLEKCALKRDMLEYLFDATFLVALNALAGDRISGMGLKNILDWAQHGPTAVLALSEEDDVPDELAKRLESMEGPPDDIDQVLDEYKKTEYGVLPIGSISEKGHIGKPRR